MSLRAMIWAFDQQVDQPGAKLVLLALANYANEDHIAYPSQARIAKMTSQGERTVRTHLKNLCDAGLIAKVGEQTHEKGRFKQDRYQLFVTQAAKFADGEKQHLQAAKNDTKQAAKFADNPKEDKPQEEPIDPLPTVVDSAGSRKTTKDQQREAHQREQQALADQAGISLRADVPLGVPAVQMVMAYHHYLPVLPRCVAITNDRAKKLSARWKDCGEDANSWKHVLVDKIAPSTFLTGRSQARPGSEPFRATIDWIIGPENFVKIIEGKYVNGRETDYSSVQ